MTVQMRRDVTEQETSHSNKWLGKQRKAAKKRLGIELGGGHCHTQKRDEERKRTNGTRSTKNKDSKLSCYCHQLTVSMRWKLLDIWSKMKLCGHPVTLTDSTSQNLLNFLLLYLTTDINFSRYLKFPKGNISQVRQTIQT